MKKLNKKVELKLNDHLRKRSVDDIVKLIKDYMKKDPALFTYKDRRKVQIKYENVFKPASKDVTAIMYKTINKNLSIIESIIIRYVSDSKFGNHLIDKLNLHEKEGDYGINPDSLSLIASKCFECVFYLYISTYTIKKSSILMYFNNMFEDKILRDFYVNITNSLPDLIESYDTDSFASMLKPIDDSEIKGLDKFINVHNYPMACLPKPWDVRKERLLTGGYLYNSKPIQGSIIVSNKPNINAYLIRKGDHLIEALNNLQNVKIFIDKEFLVTVIKASIKKIRKRKKVINYDKALSSIFYSEEVTELRASIMQDVPKEITKQRWSNYNNKLDESLNPNKHAYNSLKYNDELEELEFKKAYNVIRKEANKIIFDNDDKAVDYQSFKDNIVNFIEIELLKEILASYESLTSALEWLNHEISNFEYFYIPYDYEWRGRIISRNNVFGNSSSRNLRDLINFHKQEELNQEGAQIILDIYNNMSKKSSSLEELLGNESLKDIYIQHYINENLIEDGLLTIDRLVNVKWAIPMSIDVTASGLQLITALTRCEKTSKLLNLEESESKNDVYHFMYIKTMEKIREMLEDDPNNKNLLIIADKIKGCDRKLLKKPIMIICYSAKERKIKDTIMEENPNMFNDSEAFLLARIILKTFKSELKLQYDFLECLRNKASIVLSKERSIEWESYKSSVSMEYLRNTERRMKLKQFRLDEETDKIIKTVKTIQYHSITESCPPNIIKARQAISPNIIHSLDALVLRTVICKLASLGIDCIPVHDQIYVHPNHIDTAKKWWAMATFKCVEYFLENLKDFNIPKGNFDLEKIKNANFIIS